MKKFGFTTLLLGLVVVLMSSSVSKAGLMHGYSLSDLISGNGTIVNGDKKFSNFTWQDGGNGVAASGITVAPVTDVHGNLGIRLVGGFFDLAGGGASDTLVGFDVEVTDPGQWISDVHLLFNGTLNGGHGFAQVTETVQNPNWMEPLQMSVIESNLPGGQHVKNLAAWIDPLPRRPSQVKRLRIVKDIQLLALSPSLPVNISFIDQTFSQIPEPASMGLAVAGVLGMLAARRRS